MALLELHHLSFLPSEKKKRIFSCLSASPCWKTAWILRGLHTNSHLSGNQHQTFREVSRIVFSPCKKIKWFWFTWLHLKVKNLHLWVFRIFPPKLFDTGIMNKSIYQFIKQPWIHTAASLKFEVLSQFSCISATKRNQIQLLSSAQ